MLLINNIPPHHLQAIRNMFHRRSLPRIIQKHRHRIRATQTIHHGHFLHCAPIKTLFEPFPRVPRIQIVDCDAFDGDFVLCGEAAAEVVHEVYGFFACGAHAGVPVEG